MIPAVFQVGFALDDGVGPRVRVRAPDRVVSRITPEALFAVVWLGILGSGLAYLLFFRTLGRWGATRTSMVAYLLPVFGITSGALVLQRADRYPAAGRDGPRHRRPWRS